MGALFGGGESTNWNMQQIQCMVEIWGDLPIRTHSSGWCHIRWPLFSRNWKMMFPRVVFFCGICYFLPRKGRCLLGYSWIGLHEGVSRPAEHQHTLSQPKIHFPSFAIFALLELLWVPGTVGNYNSWCAVSARMDWKFQPEWFLHHTRFSNPRVVWFQNTCFGRTPKNHSIIVSALPKTNSKRTWK